MTNKPYALRRIVSGKTKRAVELTERAVCFRDAIRLAETPTRTALLQADLTAVENELASTRKIIAEAERNILTIKAGKYGVRLNDV